MIFFILLVFFDLLKVIAALHSVAFRRQSLDLFYKT